MLEFITDTEIYEQVMREWIPRAADFLWLGTSDLKDLYVDRKGQRGRGTK